MESLHVVRIMAVFAYKIRMGHASPLLLPILILDAVRKDQISAKAGADLLLSAAQWAWLPMEMKKDYEDAAKALRDEYLMWKEKGKLETELEELKKKIAELHELGGSTP